MKKILFFLQEFLKFSLIFFLSFIWLRYFIRTLWLSLVLSLGISLIIELLLHFLIKKSNAEKALKLSERENADNMFLSLSADCNSIDFFYSLAASRHPNTVKKKEFILINHKNDKKVALYPFLALKPLTPNQLLLIYNKLKKEKVEKIVIVCHEYDKNSTIFAKNLECDIIILNRYECYSKLFKEYDYFPEITVRYKKETALTFKALVAYSFNKSRVKGYLLSSIILFIMSFFVKINIYYCVVSSVLLLFALISYLNPKYNTKISGSIL